MERPRLVYTEEFVDNDEAQRGQSPVAEPEPYIPDDFPDEQEGSSAPAPSGVEPPVTKAQRHRGPGGRFTRNPNA